MDIGCLLWLTSKAQLWCQVKYTICLVHLIHSAIFVWGLYWSKIGNDNRRLKKTLTKRTFVLHGWALWSQRYSEVVNLLEFKLCLINLPAVTWELCVCLHVYCSKYLAKWCQPGGDLLTLASQAHHHMAGVTPWKVCYSIPPLKTHSRNLPSLFEIQVFRGKT